MAAPPATPARGALASAADVGAQGLRTAGRFTRAFVTAAGWVDVKLYGWRATILGILAGLVIVASWIDPTLYAVLLSLLGALLLAFALGRIAAARAEDTGSFSWAAAGHALLSGFRGTWAAMGAFLSPETSGMERMRMAGSLLTFLGVIIIAVQPPITEAACDLYPSRRAFEEDWGTSVVAAQVIGWLFLAIGLTLHTWRLILKQRLARALPPGARDPGTAAAITRSLPAVLDLCDPNAGRQYAAKTDLLSRVVGALATWRTRGGQDEEGYRRSLVRHLNNTLPECNVQTERPVLTKEGVLGRLDVAIGGVVALELKRRLSPAARGAIDQVWQYARSWDGPVLLVVCETDFGFAHTMLAQRIHDLRTQGLAVFAVAAGVRRG